MSEYTWILSSISIFLVFIGWGVVYYNAKRLATRSETKSLIDNLIKTIDGISDASVDFWLTMPNETVHEHFKIHKYALLISSKMAQASCFFQFIKARGVCVSDDLLAEMNDKATLNCEQVFSLSEGESAVRAQEIKETCTSAIEHLFNEFETTHPPSSHKSIVQHLKGLSEGLESWSRTLGPNRT
ncbi:hypothetical protein [Pantoea agglomerans]|uniref:hypothetical protein n=1 Tax=Enterobacter agglomerans TaxID=549 RepID=UPI0012F9FC61|nr:hypothetical protein [Pantoea agglomerans]MVT81206.1 hypothetical protein [Pantoea agglomerans]